MTYSLVDIERARFEPQGSRGNGLPLYPDLAGKVAVVTGGSRGLGRATALLLACNGVRVAVVARHEIEVEQVAAAAIAKGVDAIGLPADCTSASQVQQARSRVEQELGPVDILLTFAGGSSGIAPMWEITDADWQATIDANLTATFLTVREFLPTMLDRRRGSIVTVSSAAGRHLDALAVASYAAAKSGITMLTRHVAREVAAHGVRANVVAPATTSGPRLGRRLDPQRLEATAALTPLQRIGDPADTAMAATFLASEASSWITGITLDVSGGRVMM